MKNYLSFFKVILIVFPIFSYSQTQNISEDVYTLFDNTVGIDNIGIYNGVEYEVKFRAGNNTHSYFNSPDFLKGSIDYDGESYFGVNIKYNLYEQEVVAKMKNRNSAEVIITLFKDKINSFTVDNHKFIKITKASSNSDNIFGFYEKSFISPDLTLFIKHKKFKKDLYQNEQMYVEFVEAKKQYVLLYNKTYIELTSKKDIVSVFPNLKQEIDKFYRNNRLHRKTDYSQFLIQLLQELKQTKLK
ncbi:hypothetical protein [Pontimicrobium sp. SW4]|uniref:Uncharacterized protein n=1 Tax=Pontimicrobium sp. SW4 TaxID=3153519 RepID=A0AAU7BVA2_9FLAO